MRQIGDLKLYTIEEVSEALGVSHRTIRLYLHEGRIAGNKLGNRWYVSEDAIRAYFEEQPAKVGSHDGNTE